MRVGVTGHQDRRGIDWGWARDALTGELARLESSIEGWSSLAVGADQLFARCVLELGGSIVTVLPGGWYEECFEGAGLEGYRALICEGSTILLDGLEGEAAFLEAGKRVADGTEVLFAIWDGEPAQGQGGTADIVEHALLQGREVVRIDPIARRISRPKLHSDRARPGR